MCDISTQFCRTSPPKHAEIPSTKNPDPHRALGTIRLGGAGIFQLVYESSTSPHEAWAHLPPMRALVETLDALARKDVVVSLVGEGGTGKDLLAHRLHLRSHRAHGPYVVVPCGTLYDATLGGDLFGVQADGARSGQPGKLELADHGTLVLDDVAALHPASQERLLRVLELGRLVRDGGTERVRCDVRLVCTSRRPLEDEVAAGRLAAELFYRVQGISLRVPPLRERLAELASLTEHFSAELSRRHDVLPPRLTREARAALLRHGWPGNIRELRNVVEGLCLMRGGRPVRLSDLPAYIAAPSAAPATITLPLDRPLAELRSRIIHAVLDAEGGHQRRAADRLGISTRTLQRQSRARSDDADADDV